MLQRNELSAITLPEATADRHDHAAPVEDVPGQERPFDCQLTLGTVNGRAATVGLGGTRVLLVDSHDFTRECIVTALTELYPGFSLSAFRSVADLCSGMDLPVDLIIYHAHDLDAESLTSISRLRNDWAPAPVVVLSDAYDPHDLQMVREALQSGAHGFVATRTTGISTALAAIRFVKSGGTFAPLDLLLSETQQRQTEKTGPVNAQLLTHRQVAVLSHLQQGKANKIIAHELGMSESTVKVHVRNIMRKMGATNRTQAAFNAQKLRAVETRMRVNA